jgi:GTP cyclohydrolase I
MTSEKKLLEAIKTFIEAVGEDPNREGLQETPQRIANMYKEIFSGYSEDPQEILSKTFSEYNKYDDIVVLRNIDFESYCEHHMVPIIGHVHIGYIPNKKVVGISKLARIVDVFAKRMQLQERMTAQIADSIQKALNPKGVIVIVTANHQCISSRGVKKKNAEMQTMHMTGVFKTDESQYRKFLDLIKL